MPRKKSRGEVVRSPRRLTDGSVTLQLLGCYYVDEDQGPQLIEVMVEAPWYLMNDPQSFRLYTAPQADEPPAAIRPQFILDPHGEALIGSYLHPWRPEAPPRTRAGYFKLVRFRFAAFWPETGADTLLTPYGLLTEMDWEPIPERLLRLVWLET
jgi:hypothetical protein